MPSIATLTIRRTPGQVEAEMHGREDCRWCEARGFSDRRFDFVRSKKIDQRRRPPAAEKPKRAPGRPAGSAHNLNVIQIRGLGGAPGPWAEQLKRGPGGVDFAVTCWNPRNHSARPAGEVRRPRGCLTAGTAQNESTVFCCVPRPAGHVGTASKPPGSGGPAASSV